MGLTLAEMQGDNERLRSIYVNMWIPEDQDIVNDVSHLLYLEIPAA